MRYKHSDEKEKWIYDCAFQLFKEKGYDETTMRDISQASGMPIGSIYHFFENKLEFLIRAAKYIGEEEKAYYDSLPESLPQSERLLQFLLFDAAKWEAFGQRLSQSFLINFPKLWLDESNEPKEYFGYVFLQKDFRKSQEELTEEEKKHLIAFLIYYSGIISSWAFFSLEGVSLIELTEKYFPVFTE